MRIRSGMQHFISYGTVAVVSGSVLQAGSAKWGTISIMGAVLLAVPTWLVMHFVLQWLNALVSRTTKDRRWLCSPEGRRWLTTTEGRSWRREQSRAKITAAQQ